MIKVLELFGGIGACSKALERLGIDHQIVDYVEIDKYAVKSFNSIHGTNFEPQDITKWDKDIDVDLIMHGSPCFVAGTPILTEHGYVPIESIKVGDMVLTHDGKNHKVLKHGGKKSQQTYTIKAKGNLPLMATANHPFYTIRRTSRGKYHGNNDTSSEPQWVELKDLTRDDFVAIDIPQENKNPYSLTKEDCWLLGRYVADGHIRHQKRLHRKDSYQYGVIYSIGSPKVKEFQEHLVSRHATIYPHTKNCYRAVISSQELVELIEKLGFGTSALTKTIPQEIIDLPIDLATAFLDGYMSGDGCYYHITKVYSMTTVSRDLALSFQRLVAKVYRVGASIYRIPMPSTCTIEGRICNQRDQYQVRFYKERRKASKWFLADEKIWYKVDKIEKSSIEDVYNLEVQGANSYTASNLVVHNCQDFSNAGLGRGGDEGSGTRSSLMYETLRIVEKLKPKYVIWENVKGVLSKKHKHNFDAYQDRMKDLGYDNYCQVLNAKNYGIPQNRERVFTISIRKDLNRNFEFPEPIPLEKRLKDLLEDNVEEKYYLSDKMVAGLLRHNKNHSAKGTGFIWKPRDPSGVASTLRANGAFAPTDNSIVVAGSLDIKGQDCIKRVYSPEGVSPTLTTMGGGNREPKIIEGTYANRDARVHNEYSPALRSERSGLKVAEPFIAASRGRNPEGPSSRTPGIHTEQRLEPKYDGTTNTITTVQKDNYVCEPRLEFVGGVGEKDWAGDSKRLSRNFPQGSRVYDAGGIAATLSSQGVGGVGGYSGNYRLPNYRIRKLTPLECWRLMGFDDEDFDKASKVNSNTRLYQQAGNSIVVSVLQAILKQLIPKDNYE